MAVRGAIIRGKTVWRPLAAGVTLAAYLVAALGLPVPLAAAPATATSAGTTHFCCCGPGSCAKVCCCAKRAARAEKATAETTTDSTPRWGASMNVLKCRGLTTFWVSSGCLLPPPAVDGWSVDVPELDSLPRFCQFPTQTLLIPPIPPPRHMA